MLSDRAAGPAGCRTRRKPRVDSKVAGQLGGRDRAVAGGWNRAPAGSRLVAGPSGRLAKADREQLLPVAALGFLERQNAVAVGVEEVMEPAGEVGPDRAKAVALDADVKPHEQRPRVGEEEDVLDLVAGRGGEDVIGQLVSRAGDRQAADSRRGPEPSARGRMMRGSCQGLHDRPGVGVGDPDRPADVREVLLRRVDPQRHADGGDEVGHGDRPLLDRACRRRWCGRSTWPPLMPPPASTVVQAAGKWSRPALLLILGVRPNSPIQTISVESSRPAAPEVVHQGRPAGVEHAAELLDRLEVLLVRVPAERLVAVDARERHLDERHPALDQPAGEQAALAERVAAVGVAERGGLVVEVERLDRRSSASAATARS